MTNQPPLCFDTEILEITVDDATGEAVARTGTAPCAGIASKTLEAACAYAGLDPSLPGWRRYTVYARADLERVWVEAVNRADALERELRRRGER